jgi:hypothetical protein
MANCVTASKAVSASMTREHGSANMTASTALKQDMQNNSGNKLPHLVQ